MKAFFAACLTALTLTALPAKAQSFPDHPVTIVVPYSAGGPVDPDEADPDDGVSHRRAPSPRSRRPCGASPVLRVARDVARDHHRQTPARQGGFRPDAGKGRIADEGAKALGEGVPGIIRRKVHADPSRFGVALA